MTMFEEARSLYTMMKMRKMTQCEFASAIGMSQSYIANKIRLLKLSERAQSLILELGLSERHARALLRIKDERTLIETAEKIHDMSLTVAASEALIDTIAEPREISLESSGLYTGVELFENSLKDALKCLKARGMDVDLRTSFFERTRYITISIVE